jgi:hypothetical protein
MNTTEPTYTMTTSEHRAWKSKDANVRLPTRKAINAQARILANTTGQRCTVRRPDGEIVDFVNAE